MDLLSADPEHKTLHYPFSDRQLPRAAEPHTPYETDADRDAEDDTPEDTGDSS